MTIANAAFCTASVTKLHGKFSVQSGNSRRKEAHETYLSGMPHIRGPLSSMLGALSGMRSVRSPFGKG